MHSIPKLLRPVIDIQNDQNPILTYFEMGAWDPWARRMIELGIARETAIRISREIKSFNVLEGEIINDKLLIDAVKKIRRNLNYWEQLQIDDFI